MSRVLPRIQLLRVGFGQHVLDGHGLVGPDGRLVGLALLFPLLGACLIGVARNWRRPAAPLQLALLTHAIIGV
jgi:hypothetical protein